MSHDLPDGTPLAEAGVGELLHEAVAKGGELARLEVSLAKAELRSELIELVKGAGALIGAGVCALIAVSVLSSGIAQLLGRSAGLVWGYGIVVGVWILAACVLAVLGRRHVPPAPPQETLRTLQDTAEWARHPTRSGTETASG